MGCSLKKYHMGFNLVYFILLHELHKAKLSIVKDFPLQGMDAEGMSCAGGSHGALY